MTNVPQPLSALDSQVCHIYRTSTLSQKDIAAILEVETWRVSDILIAHIPYSIRAARTKATAQSTQTLRRVAPPSWWEGPLCTSVPLHHVRFCEGSGLTYLPDGACVVHIDGDRHNNDYSNLKLVTTDVAAEIARVRHLIRITQLREEYIQDDSL